jgi:tRNA (adenine22-N1)-methyltransferase
MCAALVPSCTAVADIGTDHAYLPIFLVAQGHCVRAVATDISQGSVEKARRNVRRFGAQDRVEVLCGDGLHGMREGGADCYCFCGYGGTLMRRILYAGRDLLCREGVSVVCQPSSRAEETRQILLELGLRITQETACYDQGRPYGAIQAIYDATHIPSVSPAFVYQGLLPALQNPAAQDLLSKTHARLETRARHLKSTGCGAQEAQKILRVIEDWR